MVESHKTVRVLLLILSTIAAIAGLLLLFGSGWIESVAPASLHFSSPDMFTVFAKFFGVLALTGAYLLYVTSRDPVRYVAFIDGFAFLLVAAATLDMYALFALHVEPFFPAKLVVARSIVRLALAVTLVALRPRTSSSSR